MGDAPSTARTTVRPGNRCRWRRRPPRRAPARGWHTPASSDVGAGWPRSEPTPADGGAWRCRCRAGVARRRWWRGYCLAHVAMDNLILVRVLDRGAGGAKELQPLDCIEFVVVTVNVDRKALDIIHDEIRQAAFGDSAVQKPGDVGVIEMSENL